MAIVPYRPTLHAVVFGLWAEAQSASKVSEPCAEFQSEAHEGQMQLAKATSDRMLSLPSTISLKNPKAFLEDSSCKRSTRLSWKTDGFRHIQLEDHPRKRRCVWFELPVSDTDGDKVLNNPPQPSDEQCPGQIPSAVLQGWGIDCSVDPMELTDDALNQEPLAMVIHDDTTIRSDDGGYLHAEVSSELVPSFVDSFMSFLCPLC